MPLAVSRKLEWFIRQGQEVELVINRTHPMTAAGKIGKAGDGHGADHGLWAE